MYACAKSGWHWHSGIGENILKSFINFHQFAIISHWEVARPFLWIKLNHLHPRMICCKFGWNSPVVLEMFFLCRKCIFDFLLSPHFGKGTRPFFSINLNSLYPRMLCAKLWWNCHSGSEDDGNVKHLQTDGQASDGNRRSGNLKVIRVFSPEEQKLKTTKKQHNRSDLRAERERERERELNAFNK